MRTRRIGILMAVMVFLAGVSTGVAVAETIEKVITVEGLVKNGNLSQLQKSYAEKWGLQCGFCTPGMLMSSYALLLTNPDPSREEIRIALAGNLCRCTGYSPIIDSVQYAAQKTQEVTDA